MAIKRVIDTDFWTDDKVIELFSPKDKLFMLYILTNPHTTQLGIYKINKKVMAFELGYNLDTIESLLDKFEKQYKIIIYSKETNEIAIKNYLKYSVIKGGKPVEDCLTRDIQQVKDKRLIYIIFNNIKNCTNINDTVKKIIDIYINNNDNDNEVSYYDTYNDTVESTANGLDIKDNNKTDNNKTNVNNNIINNIVEFLNQLAGTNFKSTTKETQKDLNLLLKDYTENEIKNTIKKMVEKWKNTKMEDYLRPSTLFRKSNFDEYYGLKEGRFKTQKELNREAFLKIKEEAENGEEESY